MNTPVVTEQDGAAPQQAPIRMSSPPVDPLAQLQPPRKTVQPQKVFSSVKQYSGSELERKKRRRAKRIFTFLSLVTLACLGMAIFLFGPDAYKKLTANPNKSFEAMLPLLLSVDSESYGIESSAEFGIVSARVSRDSSSFFEPKTKASVGLDLVSQGVIVDAQVESFADSQVRSVQNITSLLIQEGTLPYTGDGEQLVAQKWVSVPRELDYEEEGLTISFFDLATGLNDVRRVLPIGRVSASKQSSYAQKLMELKPYSYDCETTADNIVSCDVRVDTSALNEFYSFIAKDNGVTYPEIVPNYIDKFTLFINTDTNLPVELRAEENDSVFRMVMDFNDASPSFALPVGPVDIGTYRVFARQFEATL